MSTDFVKLTHDGALSELRINRPERLNALDADVLLAIEVALNEVAARRETRCLIVTGEGKAFVAGADISAMQSLDALGAANFAHRGQRAFAQLEALSCPVIAAVNGFALGGGCELALACDFIYASDKAKFGQPEVKLGVIPGFGGTQRLARRVGVGVARELIFTGAVIGAEEALRIGLVNRVIPGEQLLEEAKKTATTIATMGPLAVASAKRVILDGEDHPLPDANTTEAKAFGALFNTADQKEGMTAFLEKRAAVFGGN